MKSDIIWSASKIIACDGSGDLKHASLKTRKHHDNGHPVVYLALQPDVIVSCPYCDKKYQWREGRGEAGTYANK